MVDLVLGGAGDGGQAGDGCLVEEEAFPHLEVVPDDQLAVAVPGYEEAQGLEIAQAGDGVLGV